MEKDSFVLGIPRLSNALEELKRRISLSYVPKLGTEWCRSITAGVERTVLTDSLSSLSTPSDRFMFQQ